MQFVYLQNSGSRSLQLKLHIKRGQYKWCPVEGAMVHVKVCATGFICFEYFPTQAEFNLILILLTLTGASHSETSHLLSYLLNAICARAWLRWKGGEWWKLSCLSTPNSFHSSARCVQAPNDTNSEMKAANLTVSGTELWCLAANCLPGCNRGTHVL